MGRTGEFLRTVFGRGRRGDDARAEELRIDFKTRYHHFKLLLTANNRSLELMAEIDASLAGDGPFGMREVRSWCTRVSTQVFQIVQHLEALAPGRYGGLKERFGEIRGRIAPFLEEARGPEESGGPRVLPLDDVDGASRERTGAKMAHLGELRNRLGLPTPDGFVVTAQGYRSFLAESDLQPEIDRRIQAGADRGPESLHALSASLQQLIIGAPVPDALAREILAQCRRLEGEGGTAALAVRSSALGEDEAGASFAGQYRSVLNVAPENVLQAYKEVVAGKYGLPAMTYRRSRGIRDGDVDICVGCLRMVDAVAGGVMYTRNPVDPRDEAIVVSAAWGLPKTVVDGGAQTDVFVMSRESPPRVLERRVASKERRLVPDPAEGVRRETLGEEEGLRPSLTDDQAVALARLGLRLEEHYGSPQDVEWAVDRDGAAVLLQCRPLQLEEAGAPGEGREASGGPVGRVVLSGGVTASPGLAAGPVFVVRKDADALSFPAGAVLVTARSLPRWAVVLDRAAAVVAEQGGVAGHLASVAREFGVPALFGVPGATEALTPGAVITVDADRREVVEGRPEALPERRRRSLMQGSAVHRALEGAARHITPLGLLDPDAPEFQPGNCRTLHDITRFAHEKSVQEMFRFGKDHHFPERSSKQLFCDVPMQWWVLNLDDGFVEEVRGRYVGIQNICSVPMRALWEGITAVPWEGPPSVDGKGFLSVMFEATRNPALNTGVPSRYASRNYFMISRNFCNLSSRLGFHFSTVEALVGERAGDNFASFQFRGGAADYDRRRRRVVLVESFLEACGFRVEIRDDHLTARLEGFDRPFMEARLKVLGYLTIHTRQLDMIMANEASVAHYRSRILAEIRRMLPSGCTAGDSEP